MFSLCPYYPNFGLTYYLKREAYTKYGSKRISTRSKKGTIFIQCTQCDSHIQNWFDYLLFFLENKEQRNTIRKKQSLYMGKTRWETNINMPCSSPQTNICKCHISFFFGLYNVHSSIHASIHSGAKIILEGLWEWFVHYLRDRLMSN